MNSSPPRFLGASFKYHEGADQKVLDESLHLELDRLSSHIKRMCEFLYQDEALKPDTRLYMSVWIPLEGLERKFPRKDDPEHFRLFELEIAVLNDDVFSFTLFEDITEDAPGAPFRNQSVAEADVDKAMIGMQLEQQESNRV
jgi:hypothetical protein